MAKHLVTGGNGYLGAFIARELLQMGEQVVVVDIVDDPSRPAEIEFQNVDILDRSTLDKVMSGVDYVHHNAALVPIKKAGPRFWAVNVDGTQNVLDAAKKAGVKHLAYMSSSAVFGSLTAKDFPLPDHPKHLGPIESYGESKAAGEKIILDEMNRPVGLSCSIIRPRTIIGTERLGIFQILFEWISEGRNIYIIGSGKNLFQFAHVDDLVFASIQSCLRQKKGIFNIGTDRYGTLREGLERLCERAGTKSKVRSLPVWLSIGTLWFLDKTGLSPLGPYHYRTYHKPYAFDLTTPKSALQWQPKYSNDEMLWQSYSWYLQNKKILAANKAQKSAHRGGLKQGFLRLIKIFS